MRSLVRLPLGLEGGWDRISQTRSEWNLHQLSIQHVAIALNLLLIFQ